ncbi:hypothetical protein Acr_16g0001560 [Actinidia rufa]|uniref:Uncharacterized protein n=1 Tax=Actinidia rufa TaxID=165716 RepID=A0A7J0FXV9_9ERIC|nr:hypothetical protein Acr_15g0005680 [Actinidia rufa]GFZ03532.1 hypothetical protein Acr_16g0001560 [Actinidia rufa]
MCTSTEFSTCIERYLDKEKRRSGEEVDLVGRENLEDDEVADPFTEAEAARRFDLMADLRDDNDALLMNLLHFEAIRIAQTSF